MLSYLEIVLGHCFLAAVPVYSTKFTGWQPHTVRGFIAGSLKNSGIIVNSIKATNGQRTYSA